MLGSSGNGYFTRGGRRSTPAHNYMESAKEFKQLLMPRIDTAYGSLVFKLQKWGSYLKDCLGESGDMFLKKKSLIIELFVLFE